MTSYVTIDAGLVFKLIVPNPDRDQLKKRVEQWTHEELVLCAPSLWLYELTSIFTKMVHFDELSEEEGKKGLALALALDIQLIQPNAEQARQAYAWTRRLGRAAAYDSFYLALAETLQCELWTVDRRLVNAARQPWVRLAGAD